MHDDEPDTFVLKTVAEKFCDSLKDIGLEAQAKEIGTQDVEKGDYYSRCFSQTPRMVTNKGCILIKNSNIDLVQIIQKG